MPRDPPVTIATWLSSRMSNYASKVPPDFGLALPLSLEESEAQRDGSSTPCALWSANNPTQRSLGPSASSVLKASKAQRTLRAWLGSQEPPRTPLHSQTNLDIAADASDVKLYKKRRLFVDRIPDAHAQTKGNPAAAGRPRPVAAASHRPRCDWPRHCGREHPAGVARTPARDQPAARVPDRVEGGVFPRHRAP